MKVLHIATGLGVGGAEEVLMRLVLADREDEHHVVSLTAGGPCADRLSESGVPVQLLGMPRGRITVAGVRALYRTVRRFKPDVVQTWMYHADLIGGLVARSAGGRAVVWGVHNGDLSPERNSRSTRRVARLSALLSSVVPRRIVSSSPSARDVHAALGYRASLLTVISNGIDVSVFRPDEHQRSSVRAEWNLAPGERAIGMVGRWDPQKDHASLIAALAILAGDASGWTGFLIGPAIDEGNVELRQMLQRAGVADRVRLIGPRRDVPAAMNALDLHVLSSCGESFGNVTAEAMACGTPAAATDVGGASAIIGATGWVVPPRAPVALAGALRQALAEMANAPRWRDRQRDARLRIETKFGLDDMVRAYRAVWHDAVSRPAS